MVFYKEVIGIGCIGWEGLYEIYVFDNYNVLLNIPNGIKWFRLIQVKEYFKPPMPLNNIDIYNGMALIEIPVRRRRSRLYKNLALDIYIV